MRKIFVLAVCVLIATSGFAQQTVYKKVRINMKDRTIHELVALGIPSDNLYVRPGVSVTAELSEVDLQKMQLAGFQYEVLVENMRDYYVKRNAESPRTQSTRQSCGSAVYYPTPQYFGLGSFAGFYTYDEMLAELDSMQARFPNLVSLKQVVGTHNTIEGRQIMYVKISDNPAIDEPEPEVLYTGLHHAREPASMQQLFFYMYYLLENYNTNTEIHALLDNLELYFIPCVNPDGYIYNEVNDPAGGGLWRKNVKDNGDGTFGVDINRNYGYEWGYDDAGSSPDGSSDAYRGTAGFSEPETQSMKEFVESHEFKLALNYHCYSDLLIYPWGFIEDYFTPDSLIFREFARLMTLENGYLAGTASQTVAYTGNGTSDDWMYGEQGTKPKVFAMSPEAGSMDDGFWPAINRIEELCRENVGMDLWLARFATTYAKTEDQTEAFIGDYSYFFKYNLKKLGLTDAAGFSVRVEGISGGISNAGGTNIHADPGLLNTIADSIELTIDPGVISGQIIEFVVITDNGMYEQTDTIRKVFGNPTIAFVDHCDNLNNWTSAGGWNVTSSTSVSSPSSITDSPSGNYSSSANTSLTLKNPVDLRNSGFALLSFDAKWDIEKGVDYVQLLASVDSGATWNPVCGKYTVLGTSDQQLGEPVYDGGQTNWVKEEVDMADLIGHKVLFRFELHSDWVFWVTNDGFYFDDFTIRSIENDTATAIRDALSAETNVVLYPNPASDFVELRCPKCVPMNTSVLSAEGKKCGSLQWTKSDGLLSANISQLESGVYYLVFRQNENSTPVMKKLVVVR